MRAKCILPIILLMLVASAAWAEAKNVRIEVKGMVCGFCAQGIEKKFRAQASVDQIDVNLSQKIVTLKLKDGQSLSDDTIKSVLTESGYKVEKINRGAP